MNVFLECTTDKRVTSAISGHSTVFGFPRFALLGVCRETHISLVRVDRGAVDAELKKIHQILDQCVFAVKKVRARAPVEHAGAGRLQNESPGKFVSRLLLKGLDCLFG